MIRQERYKVSGVRGLWIFRRPGFPIIKDLPAVSIGGDLKAGLTASIPGPWQQSLPMKDFLAAAFDRRFKFGLQPDQMADLSIWTGMMDCWSCGCETKMLSHAAVSVVGQSFHFGVQELDRFGLLDLLRPHLKSISGIGMIKPRFSKTVGDSYMSNGCAHCDALLGRFFEHEAEMDEAPAVSMKVALSPQWKAAMVEHGFAENWWIEG